VRVLVDHSGYELLNIGDIAMLQACIRRLKALWPDAVIQVYTESPERLAQYCPGALPVGPTILGRKPASLAPKSLQLAAEQAFKMALPLAARRKRRRSANPNPGRILGAIRQADLVVSSGGGFVNDVFWVHAAGVLGVLAAAQRLGKPTAMFGQGIGPLTHPVLTRLVARTMPRLSVVGVREGIGSLPLLLAQGVQRERIDVTGDDALLLATGPRRPPLGSAIGLNVRVASYSGVNGGDARRAAAVTSEAARRHGVSAMVLPVSRYATASDLESIRTSGAGAAWEFADLQTPEELAEHAARCRVVVTGSYHAAVFALAAGVPAVCLTNSGYYDNKFGGLAALFPGGCHIVRHGPTFERDLSDAIEDAWETSETDRDAIHSAALAQVARADDLYARFKAMAHTASGEFDPNSPGATHPR
jgi:polysaccharide pyruvyl transferase WcaK-like protein